MFVFGIQAMPHSILVISVFEKVNPIDAFDPEWLMMVHLGPVQSIEEVDKIGNAIKDEIFDMLSLILIPLR